jgi:hypothetical protein
MSEDSQLLTLAQLMERWKITGTTARAKTEAFRRRAGAWGLKPLQGTRGPAALFRPQDVLKAEEKAAKKGGNAV